MKTLKTLKIAAILPVTVLLCGMRLETMKIRVPVGQPTDERAAQAQLPKSQSPVWAKFLKSRINYDNKSGLYSIALPPDVRALAGVPISVNGFVLPLDGSDHTSHFLLTRNTPVCMFCPPGQPNEVVEVIAPKAIAWTDKLVAVTGPLTLVNNGEKGIFFQIKATEVR
jgi:hypothetical protein